MTTANPQQPGSESSNTMDSFSRNVMGTVDFMAKWGRMREAQQFMVYPIKAGQLVSKLTIQSKTRIGMVDLVTGWVELTPPKASGSYFIDLIRAVRVHRLSAEELLMLKAHVMGSADGTAGKATGGVIVDNTGALDVFNDKEDKAGGTPDPFFLG